MKYFVALAEMKILFACSRFFGRQKLSGFPKAKDFLNLEN